MSDSRNPSTHCIDAVAWAREARHLEGQVPVVSLERLRDMLEVSDGFVTFSVEGETDKDGVPFLHLHVGGSLQLRCQRCLAPVNYPLELSNRLRLVRPGEVWPDEALQDDSFDAIDAVGAVDVLMLIEEEILLGLPPYPHHEYCLLPQKGLGGVGDQSPFSVLADLNVPRH
ncbi:MAG: DUF177 domain-containing protein [Betaproteobacteria bacterium]|nr:DUF177 domain-containing protein [Betaproteobacteria bacterium]